MFEQTPFSWYPSRWGIYFFLCPNLFVLRVPLFELFVINFACLQPLSKVFSAFAEEKSGAIHPYIVPTPILFPSLYYSHPYIAAGSNSLIRGICIGLARQKTGRSQCSLDANPELLSREVFTLNTWFFRLSSSCCPSCSWAVLPWFHRHLLLLLFPQIFQWLYNLLNSIVSASYQSSRVDSLFLNEPWLIYPLSPELFDYKNFGSSFHRIVFI